MVLYTATSNIKYQAEPQALLDTSSLMTNVINPGWLSMTSSLFVPHCLLFICNTF